MGGSWEWYWECGRLAVVGRRIWPPVNRMHRPSLPENKITQITVRSGYQNNSSIKARLHFLEHHMALCAGAMTLKAQHS